MRIQNGTVRALTFACVIAASSAIVAQDGAEVKKVDGGKGSEFRTKTYEMNEKSEIAVALTFDAGKEVTVTTKGEKETDVHLMVKGMYFEAKDTSPGPECLIKFTPAKGDAKFTLTVKHKGPGANKVTLEVKVAE